MGDDMAHMGRNRRHSVPELQGLHLRARKQCPPSPHHALTWRTPRAGQDESPCAYQELMDRAASLSEKLSGQTHMCTGGDWSCEHAAHTLNELSASFEEKLRKPFRASLRRTVFRSVSHSLARQLMSSRSHRGHHCAVGSAVLQLLRRLPSIPLQDPTLQCLVVQMALQAATQLVDGFPEQSAQDTPRKPDEALPAGWASQVSRSTGRVYYYDKACTRTQMGLHRPPASTYCHPSPCTYLYPLVSSSVTLCLTLDFR